MPDYQKMYYTLFNAMSESTQVMIKAMQETEEMYLEAEPMPIVLAKPQQQETDTPNPCAVAHFE